VYANPVWETKGRLRPLWARINGKAEHHPEGVYALRYGSKWEFCNMKLSPLVCSLTAPRNRLCRWIRNRSGQSGSSNLMASTLALQP